MGTRYVAVVASGVLAAMGGAYLSIAFLGSFNQNMTAGRGYIALAAVIFGNWHPRGALGARCCSASPARWPSACPRSTSRRRRCSRRCPTSSR
jgi:ABC-type uncharacterized transport system permease subunit